MYKEPELLTASDNGVQAVITQLADPQVVYLDFDGAVTSYYNRDLGITIDNVVVADSGFDSASISVIVDALNGQFGDDVVFTADIPSEGLFSTIYIGVTSAFDEYGSFLGLAETIDSGNQIRDDNAFVLLDSTATAESVVSVIAHETEHIVHGMEHGGEGLRRFAATTIIENGQYTSGSSIDSGNSLILRSGGSADGTHVFDEGVMYVSNGGSAYKTYVYFDGVINVCGGTANSTAVVSDGIIIVSNGGIANNTNVYNYGSMVVSNSGRATNTIVKDYGKMIVYQSGLATKTTVSNATIYVSNGGSANETTLDNGGDMIISGGIASTTTVNNGGNLTISEGLASITTVNNGGAIVISKSGIASSTIVNSGGSMTVYSSGTATFTTVNNGALLYVQDGGKANYTTVNAGGQLYVSDGGSALLLFENGGYVQIADSATVNFMPNQISAVNIEHTTATIHSGTTANEMTVNGGQIEVYSSGSAIKTTVNSDGMMDVLNGGTVTSTTVNNGGGMCLYGGTATITTVSSGGEMGIFNSGTANSTTVNANGLLIVRENGTANYTTVSNGGSAKVSSGGSANHTTVDMGGRIYVFDGGKATDIVENGGCVEFDDDTTISFASHVIQGVTLENTTATLHSVTTASEMTLGNGCSMLLSGGKANSVAVNAGGIILVSQGGTATSVTLNANGSMRVSSGGTATKTTVNSGGTMYVSRGGIATGTTVHNSAWMFVFESGTANETTISGGVLRIDGYANSTTLNAGNLYISGSANSTTVNSDGSMGVSRGAIATNTTVNSGGWMWVLKGGTALNVLNSGGRVGGHVVGGDGSTVVSGTHLDDNSTFYISNGIAYNIRGGLILSSGGMAEGTVVKSGCSLRVNGGGTATRTTVESGGIVYVSEGGRVHISNTVNSGGTLHLSSGGEAFGLTNLGGCVGGVVKGGDQITFMGGKNEDGTTFFISSGVAFNVSGWLEVSGGGIASHTTVNGSGCSMRVAGGTANDTTVNSGGEMYVVSGGTANYITLNDDAKACVTAALANNIRVNSTAVLTVNFGGTVNQATINGGRVFVLSGGSANSTIVNKGGYMYVSAMGAVANSTTVNSGGHIGVKSATVNWMTVNDGAYVEFDYEGVVNNVTVSSGGSLIIYNNGKLRGNVSVASGAVVTITPNAKIDFTVSEQTVLTRPLIDHLGNISVADYVSFSITVAAEQASGIYALAGDAMNFKSKSAWVQTAAGTGIGGLSVGESITDASRRYSLLMDSDNTLALKVTKYHTVTKTTAGGEGSFDDAAAAGEAILFSDSVSYYYTNGLTAATAMEVIGNGTTETTLSGGNLYMAGNAASFSNLTLDGMVFGGVAASIGLGITENVSLSFSGVNFADGKRVYGGADVSDIADATVGNITLALEGASGAGARIFGAGRVADSAKLIVGNIDITVSCAEGGSFVNLFAGADVVTGFNGSIEGHNVSTVIEGGTFTYAGNGSQLRGGESKQWDSTLTVNGGTFQHYVYAGAFSMGGTATVDGDTALVINGGTFETHVFGGCGANNSDNGDKTLVSGDAGVIVNAKDATITFNGNVYAGSMGKGIINGETAMTFSGFGSNLSFSSDSYVTGSSQMARGTEKYIGGDQTLAFNGFTGDFGANVNNGFSRIVATNSNVVFTGKEEVKLNAISSWEIEAGTSEAELALGDAKNSFKGDTLTLTLAEDAELGADAWDVISGTETSLTGWDKFSSVNLAGEAATFADGEWGSDSYRLFRDGNILKLAARI